MRVSINAVCRGNSRLDYYGNRNFSRYRDARGLRVAALHVLSITRKEPAARRFTCTTSSAGKSEVENPRRKQTEVQTRKGVTQTFSPSPSHPRLPLPRLRVTPLSGCLPARGARSSSLTPPKLRLLIFLRRQIYTCDTHLILIYTFISYYKYLISVLLIYLFFLFLFLSCVSEDVYFIR